MSPLNKDGYGAHIKISFHLRSTSLLKNTSEQSRDMLEYWLIPLRASCNICTEPCNTHTHQSDMSIWTEELCKIQFSPIPQVFLLRCLLIWLVGTSAVSGCVASHQLHSGYTHTYTPMIVHRGLWSLHVSVRLKRPQLCIDFRLSNCKTDVSSASL